MACCSSRLGQREVVLPRVSHSASVSRTLPNVGPVRRRAGSSEVGVLCGGQWRRHSRLSVGDVGTCRRPGRTPGRAPPCARSFCGGPDAGREYQRMGTGLACGFMLAAWWWSHPSAYPRPSSGLGTGRSDPSLPRAFPLQSSDYETALTSQEGGELRECPAGEVVREPLGLCGVRRRPPLPLVGHVIAQCDNDRLTDSMCAD